MWKSKQIKAKDRILGNAVIYETEGVTENKQPLERPGENQDLQCTEAREQQGTRRRGNGLWNEWSLVTEKNNGTEWWGSGVIEGESVVRK